MIVLVRHGQASYGAADYDRLSPLGERQSRLAGERLAREQPSVRAVYCGPRRRHLQTAQLLVDAAGYPAPQVVDDLDELPVKELVLLHGLGPDLLASVVAAVRSWAAGTLAAPGLVTPQEFVTRVEAAYTRLCPAEGPAVLVTSGGPIAVALLRGQAIGDIGEAITRGLQLANASFTLIDRQLQLLPCEPVAHLSADEITQI